MSTGILFHSPIWWWLRYGMGCASHDFKMNLMTLRGQRNDQSYQREIPTARVVLHVNNHDLVTGKSSWMTMLGRMGVHAVMDKIMSVELLSWHARSLDLKLIEHIRDIIGNKIPAYSNSKSMSTMLED